MCSRVSEASMVAAVCEMRLFRDRGVGFRYEVPYGAKRIDLAGLSDEAQVFAVELKVENWTRAVWQASVYQLCADFAYVAIREEYCRRVDGSYLAELGVGLISVSDAGARLLLAAQASRILNPADHRRLREALAAQVLSPEGV